MKNVVLFAKILLFSLLQYFKLEKVNNLTKSIMKKKNNLFTIGIEKPNEFMVNKFVVNVTCIIVAGLKFITYGRSKTNK